uniref:Uncharacterized protein n=1 Tax=Trametes cubensis TaxID=1111947 RepID=A0AAD7X445_9APHY
MSRVSPELLRDFDDVAASVGITPRLDKLGQPIPIGQKERKGEVYVVWTGRAVGLFYNCHKKYPDYEAAVAGWFEGPLRHAGTWKPPAPRPPIFNSPLRRDGRATHSPSSACDDRLPPEIRLTTTEPHADTALTIARAATSNDADVFTDKNRNGDDDDDNDNDYGCDDNGCLDAGEEDDSWQLYQEARESFSTPSPQASPYVNFSPMLTEGTISPRTIHTPSLSSPALSISMLSPPRLTQPSPSSPAIDKQIHDDRLTQLAHDLRYKSSITKKRRIYVVLRGDRPGIYFKEAIALDMLGAKPGIKLVRFKSLSRAAWYFVLEYMAGRVGVPVLTLTEEE